MKKQTYQWTGVGIALCFTLALGCSKDGNKPVSQEQATAPSLPKITSRSLASLPQNAFNLWGTCNGHPYLISGTNGICIPLGNCTTDIDAAQQASGQNSTGFQFNGCFKGGTSASSGASEEAVFMADNVSTWNGNEMGFVKTLENNDLKAYLQGGGNYIVSSPLNSNDNGYHTYKAQARSNNSHMVDFYVDGNYATTLTNNSGTYLNNYFYMVGTNHWYGGGSNAGEQIEMYNMTTY